MTILMIVSYVFAGLVLLIFLRIFWRPIVFVAVLAWELFWKGLIPLLTLPFLAAAAVRHRRRNAATMKPVREDAPREPLTPAEAVDRKHWGTAAYQLSSGSPQAQPTTGVQTESEWMAQAGAKVDAALAGEPTRSR